MKKFVGFIKAEEGATAAEYSVMGGLIAIVIVAAVIVIGTKLQEPFTNVGRALPD